MGDEKVCLYQGHTDNIILDYIVDIGQGSCITCIKDDFNKVCKNARWIVPEEKYSLIDNKAREHFMLKKKTQFAI